MKKSLKTVFILIFFKSIIFSQDYSNYYKYIDSVEYFNSLNTNESFEKSNELYKKCFSEYVAFPNDYVSAFFLNYKVNGQICDSLVIAAFRERSSYINFKLDLEKNKIQYSKKQIKKLKRKGKKIRTPKSQSGFVVYRMLLRDQIARRGNSDKKIQKVDSLNALKIRKLIKKKPDLFNYKKTGFLTAALLQILIFHGEWKNIEPIQNELHDLIKKGHIDRFCLAYLIERNAVGTDMVFRLDTVSNSIYNTIQKVDSICLGYSNIGFEWGSVYDKTRKIHVLPPFYPNLTIEDINRLRKYLFLSDLDLMFKTKKYILAESVEEYCRLLEEKMRSRKL